MDAGAEFGEAEGLCEVVLGSGFEAAHDITFLTAGGKDEHGVFIAFASQGAADLQAGDAGGRCGLAMNTEDNNESTDVEKLLHRQRPPAAREPLPAMPDDLRQQWSAHFKPQRPVILRPIWTWVTGFAAAAAALAVIGFVWFGRGSSKTGPESQSDTAVATADLRAISADGDPALSLSQLALALLHYHDPATAGFYVRE